MSFLSTGQPTYKVHGYLLPFPLWNFQRFKLVDLWCLMTLGHIIFLVVFFIHFIGVQMSSLVLEPKKRKEN